MNNEESQIKISDYEKIKLIGSGCMSQVWEVEKKDSKKKFAAKMMLKKNTDDDNRLRTNREIEILVSCNHPTIIKFYGFSKKNFSNQNKTVILMDLAVNGSVFSLINNPKKIIDNTIKEIILIGTARGMMILHQKRIIHRDLKAGNILLDENYYPKITDFNLSKKCEYGESFNQSHSNGTYQYQAPEVAKSNNYNFKADVFSFGILMHEIICNEHPYVNYAQNKESYLEKLKKHVMKIECNITIKNLILKCLSDDPKNRPTFAEIYQCLSNINDDNICLDGIDKKRIQDYIRIISENDLNDDVYSLKASINYFEDQYNNIKAQFEDYQEFTNDRISKLENIISMNNKASEKTDTALNSTNIVGRESVLIEKQDFATDIKNLKKKIINLEEKADEINDLNVTIQNIMSDISQLKSIISKQEAQNQDCNNNINKKINSKGETIDKHENGNDDLKQVINEMNQNYNNKFKKINENIETNSEKISSLNDSVNYLKKIISTFKESQPLSNKQENSQIKQQNQINKVSFSPHKNNSISNKYRHLPKNDDSFFNINMLSPQNHSNNNNRDDLDSYSDNQFELDSDESQYVNDNFISNSDDDNNAFQPNLCSPNNNNNKISTMKRANSVFNTPQNKFKHNQLNKGSKSMFIPQNVYDSSSQFRAINKKSENDHIQSLCRYNSSNLSSFLTQDLGITDVKQYIRNPEDRNTNIVSIRSELTEYLYQRNVLNSNKFIEIIEQFQQFIFEIKCPSQNLYDIYSILYNIKSKMLKTVKIHLIVESLISNKYIFNDRIDNVDQVIINGLVQNEDAFKDCSKIKYVFISHPVKSIGKNAFLNCEALCSISIPSSVNLIDQSAFMNCCSLFEIKIPSSVIKIENEAFKQCISLANVIFKEPHKIKEIGQFAFYKCRMLTKILVPSTVTSFGIGSFQKCNLIEFSGNIPPDMRDGVFGKDQKIRFNPP